MSDFSSGQEFRIPYPFIRTTYDKLPNDWEGVPVETPTWRPGVEHDCDNYGNTETFADAMGEAVFTIVDVFKPGKFPIRIFFTRKWVDPDGKVFGKGKLHITTQQNFRTLIKGYRIDFDMSGWEANNAG